MRNTIPASLAPSALIYDLDSINLASDTNQITGNYQTGLDVLSATVVSGITRSFNLTTGTLTLSQISSLVHSRTVLNPVTFQAKSTANTPSQTISFTLNDGLAKRTTVSRFVTLS
ncbi:MAG: hypothetical protein WCH39_12195 [Schlesneria sp.]